ncbi:MAG: transglycosylase domain-containing protein [Acidimicrobiales bacterium]
MWRWRRGVYVVGLLALAATSGVAYAATRIELPSTEPPDTSSVVCAADVPEGCNADNALARFHASVDRIEIDLADVPQIQIDAVIAAEDRDFFRHGGVDPIGIARALWQDLRAGGFEQGASTITQQYVRTTYLTTERTVTRKLKEAVLAIKVEQELSKEEILERYLNTAYMGRGAYGIGAAARVYFGHAITQVDLAEAAYLASLLRSPEAGDAVRDPEEATRRRETVLRAMVEEDYISEAEYTAANEVPWTVAALDDGTDGTILPRRENNQFGSVRLRQYGTEYYVDYVLQQLKALGYTDAQIFAGGLQIYTSLDPRAQRAAWQAVASTLDQPDDPLAALVAVDNQGLVRAMIGGRDYNVNRVNLALGPLGGGSGRGAGSSMKAFVLAAAAQQGISFNSLFNAPAELILPGADAGNDWVVNNYEDAEQGILRVVDGTRVSSNTLFAQLMLAVGPDNVVNIARQLGITSEIPAVPSLVLGSGDVSPFEMAVAYSSIARGGVYIQPQVITKVVWPDGRVDAFPVETRQAMDPGHANLVTSALRRVVGNGTGVNATLSVPAAGKTGTTGNYNDAWFVGYVPNGWTASVWMGYDPIQNADGTLTPRFMDNVHGRQVTGGSFPAMIWRKFMQIWIEGTDVGSFTPVHSYPGVVLNEGINTTTTLPPAPPTPTQPTPTPPLPPCGAPPTTTDPTQPCAPG